MAVQYVQFVPIPRTAASTNAPVARYSVSQECNSIGLSKWWRPGPSHITPLSPCFGGSGSGNLADKINASCRDMGSTDKVNGGFALNVSARVPSSCGTMPRDNGRIRKFDKSAPLSTRTVIVPSASKIAALYGRAWTVPVFPAPPRAARQPTPGSPRRTPQTGPHHALQPRYTTDTPLRQLKTGSLQSFQKADYIIFPLQTVN